MKLQRFGNMILVLLLLALAALPASPARAVDPITYTVTNTNDSGAGSLRWAINQANSDGDESIITFAIPGAGVHIIAPPSPLPPLVEDGTEINGYSQPGSVPATDTTPATILINIAGSFAVMGNGLSIISSDNWVTGLAINCFPWSGIAIFPFGGSSATGNVIAGNHIGINAAGTMGMGNGYAGVSISLGAQNNRVGGILPSDRNVISSNFWEGVGIHGANTMSNTVAGNYIGTAANGADPLGNALHGVRIYGGAYSNLIGGNNVISGNDQDGVYIAGENTRRNTISTNYIGITANGLADLGNSSSGVYITNGAHENTIGGDVTAGMRNTISGNDWHGVVISGTGTMSNTIAGNYIGADANGSADLGNSECGVIIFWNAQNNTIGGDTEAERNVISGNNTDGVYIGGSTWSIGMNTSGNVVSGNYIGTDANGSADLGNGGKGIRISAPDNIVGGDTEGERNVISGNGGGVMILYPFATGNTIVGNYIGTAADGTTDLGNSGYGVFITNGAIDNTIGPDNVIAYSGDGVWVTGSAAIHNIITRNSILGNTQRGIYLTFGANGGIAAPVIAATTLGSVHIAGTACPGCTVEVFENGDTDGEGETFVGDAIADAGGAFTVTVDSLSQPYLTATATDAISGTSEFSVVFESTIKSVYLPLVVRN